MSATSRRICMTSSPALGCLAALVAWATVGASSGWCQAQPARVPDVPWEPTPGHVVTQMLSLARVGATDVVYDLGCGDGRIVIAAVQLGARGVCVDIDPVRIEESRANAHRAGVADRIVFLTQDLFDTDVRDATVVALFLWPEVNLKLRPKLWRELEPGARVVSYVHDMGDWKPEQTLTVQGRWGLRTVYLWTVVADTKARTGSP